MKKLLLPLFFSLFVLSMPCVLAQEINISPNKNDKSNQDTYVCPSPNGTNTISFKLLDGQPVYSVTYGEETFIRDAALGLNLVDKPLGKFEIIGTHANTVDQTWKPVVGEWNSVRDHYHSLLVELQEKDTPHRRLNIEFRAYDEGVAFRYILPKQPLLDGAIVSSEATEFRFTKDYGTHPIPHTEAHYQETPTPVSQCRSACIPLTIELSDDAKGPMASLFEAYVSNQPPCTLQKKSDLILQPRFRAGKLTLNTPEELTWRGFIIAPNAAGLIERRYLVENLNPPCAIEDTSWIKPGKYLSLSPGMVISNEKVKQTIDFAAEHHCQAVHIDWSWYGTERKWSKEAIAHFQEHMPEKTRKLLEGQDWISNTTGDPTTVAHGYVPYLQFLEEYYGYIKQIDLDIPEVVQYGKNKGVGLSLYVNGGVLKPYGDHEVDHVWKTFSDWGVTAIKPGFVACNSQADVKWLRELVALAAKHKLLVNIHDAYIADGMRRTYPNLLTQEGGGGREGRPTVTHELTLPFGRHLVGSHDHTPTLYSGQDGRTKLFEMAQLVVYHGARQSIRNSFACRDQFGPEIEFFEKVPTVWDKVHVLVAEPGDCIVLARRSGKRWFIAGMNDEDPRQFQLPLDFLTPDTNYKATIFSDIKGSRDAKREVKEINSEDLLEVSFEPRGGFTAILEPNKN